MPIFDLNKCPNRSSKLINNGWFGSGSGSVSENILLLI